MRCFRHPVLCLGCLVLGRLLLGRFLLLAPGLLVWLLPCSTIDGAGATCLRDRRLVLRGRWLAHGRARDARVPVPQDRLVLRGR